MNKRIQTSAPGQFLHRLAEYMRAILWPETAICRACGTISDAGCLCTSCRERLKNDGFLFAWDFREIDGVPVYSLRTHTGIARQLVIRLKHQAEACLAEELAALAQPLPEYVSLPPDTVITWVTMPASRQLERCVDHGRVLAEAMGRQLNLPVRQLLLRRDDRSRAQATLNRQERQKNLNNVFSPAGSISHPVLLIDDVLTTGTTASRCIAALRDGGASWIMVWTITRASPHSSARSS